MACGKSVQPLSKHLVTTSIAETVEPYLAWTPATGVDKLKAALKRASVQLQGTAPSMHFKLAIQTAEVRTDNPGDWTTIPGFSAVAGAGETATGTLDVSSLTAGNAWFGIGAVTGFLPTLLIDKVAAFFILAGVLGNFRCRLCYRIASTSTAAPGAWTLLESAYRSSNGESSTTELALTFGTEMYVQFGVAYSQSSAGAAPGQATVSVAVATRRNA